MVVMAVRDGVAAGNDSCTRSPFNGDSEPPRIFRSGQVTTGPTPSVRPNLSNSPNAENNPAMAGFGLDRKGRQQCTGDLGH